MFIAAWKRRRWWLWGIFAAIAFIDLAVAAVMLAMSLGAPARTRLLSVLRTVGLSGRQAQGLVIWELAPLALVAMLSGLAAGLVFGVAAALAVTRVLGSLLYEVTTTDVWTYAAVTALLSLIGVVSCLVPARRALRVDPIKALRAR
jgi:ABC-type antimicrobial peptide transport system permease subunit